MNFGNDQKIESVNQSTIVQAKGDINFNGITAETAIEICKYVVKGELAVYTQDARVEAEKRLLDISKKNNRPDNFIKGRFIISFQRACNSDGIK